MFGRVEGSKQVINDSLGHLQPGIYNDNEKNIFNYDSIDVGDKLTISGDSPKVSPKGTNDETLLKQAPNSRVVIAGKEEIVRIVVDTSKNYLYTYDEKGEPTMVYLVATGDKSKGWQTDKGLRKIRHFENAPYENAYGTVRNANPEAFGPRIMYLEIVDPNTGEVSPSNGEFIHGNNDESSLGEYASHGCVRMDNDVVREIVDSGSIPAGSYVKII